MKNKYVILRHLGDMCLFTSALHKSHIPSLPQNNLYLSGQDYLSLYTKFSFPYDKFHIESCGQTQCRACVMVNYQIVVFWGVGGGVPKFPAFFFFFFSKLFTSSEGHCGCRVPAPPPFGYATVPPPPPPPHPYRRIADQPRTQAL